MPEKIVKHFGKRIIVGAYGIILFFLNFIRIFDNNFWADEAYTLTLIRGNFLEIIRGTAADVHPPLYYFLIKIAYMLFGDQGWAYHLVSLIPFAIILIWAVTCFYERFGGEASVILITLGGLSYNALFYNVEVRMYSWAALFVLLSFYELYNILQKEILFNYFLFTIFSLAAAYTHYYCLVSVAFYYITILVLGLLKRLKLKNVLLSCAATVIGYLPWFWIMMKSMLGRIDDYWITEIPTVKESVLDLFSNQFKPFVWAFIALLGIAFILQEIRIWKVKRKQSDILLWICAGLFSIMGTILFGIFISKAIRPFYITRYTYPVSIIAWVILAVFCSGLKGKKVYTAILLVYMLYTFGPLYKILYKTEKDTNYRLQETLQRTKEIESDNVILTNVAHMDWTIAEYYFPGVQTISIDPNNLPELQDGVCYWLFLNSALTDGQRKVIEERSFLIEGRIENGLLGLRDVWIYRVGNATR